MPEPKGSSCKWVWFNGQGEDVECDVEGCEVWNRADDAEVYCKYCIEGKKVDVLIDILHVLKDIRDHDRICRK